MRRAAAAGIVVLGLLVVGCAGSDDESAAPPDPTVTTETTTAAYDGCDQVDVPEPRGDGGATAPSERLDPEKTYTLTFATNCGAFVVTLDLVSAPATSASLVELAKDGFYDDTIFHRIIPGFVIQGGSPTQTGIGGPGYSTVDAPAADARYVKGVVAMAKTGTEPAGTAGSQFFVVTGDDVGLPPDYAVVGTVTDGLDVVEAIGELGDPNTEAPTQPVVVETVTVGETG